MVKNVLYESKNKIMGDNMLREGRLIRRRGIIDRKILEDVDDDFVEPYMFYIPDDRYARRYLREGLGRRRFIREDVKRRADLNRGYIRPYMFYFDDRYVRDYIDDRYFNW